MFSMGNIAELCEWAGRRIDLMHEHIVGVIRSFYYFDGLPLIALSREKRPGKQSH